MAYIFRHAICNEVYNGWDFAEACRSMKKIGYAGIEIAPFTLSEYPAEISAAARSNYRDIMESEGLEFVGLHWLMVAPKGLHVTTGDTALREKSWRHIRDLVDLCADLAGDRPSTKIMVFGSPKQRGTTESSTRAEAMKRYQDGLASVAAHSQQAGVTILAEALPAAECDVMNTLAEASAIVNAIGSPAIQTMFDTHNAADETDPHDEVVDRHFGMIRHIHVNEMDGKHPGCGNYDFKPLLRRLASRQYAHWVSLEAFDFAPGAERIATESLNHMKGEIAHL